MNLKKTQKNGVAEGFCVVRSAEKKQTKSGKEYLDLMLSDRGGEISAKLWDYSPISHLGIEKGILVKVRGTIEQYNGKDQLRVEKIRKAVESDGENISDYVAQAPFDAEEMYLMLETTAGSFADGELSKITLYVLEKYKRRLLICPAAISVHHAMRGGLLYHTCSMLAVAKKLCEVYENVDKDLLFAGVILHDVLKTEEYSVSAEGVAEERTKKGELIGHLVMGALEIENAAAACGTEDELKMLLQHMLISHHGEPEFGSSVYPLFVEAMLLNMIDNTDAKMFMMEDSAEKTLPGGFSERKFALDGRRVYNHGRCQAGYKTK